MFCNTSPKRLRTVFFLYIPLALWLSCWKCRQLNISWIKLNSLLLVSQEFEEVLLLEVLLTTWMSFQPKKKDILIRNKWHKYLSARPLIWYYRYKLAMLFVLIKFYLDFLINKLQQWIELIICMAHMCPHLDSSTRCHLACSIFTALKEASKMAKIFSRLL